ncbi:MAG: hypothetical protein KAW87_06575 [Candidatus Cloacimonetes bacterium]|nr:hypothetical protein [Candidatus Cloacimonadota bacterium]
MNKIAIDIILLPSEEMMDKVIELNKELLKHFENIPASAGIILNKENCFPHISLAMGVIGKNEILNINQVLHNISKEFSIMNLNAISIYANIIPSGEKVSCYKIENTRQLQLLHETIMNKLSNHFTYDITAEMIYSPKEVEDITLDWIRNYPKKSSFENFSPHITIGFGEIENTNLPIKFISSKLALCHLGNYCTCKKILLSINLKISID